MLGGHTTIPPPEGICVRWSAQGELFLEAQVPVAVFSEPVPCGLSVPIGKIRPGIHRIFSVTCVPKWGAMPVFVGRIRCGDGSMGTVYLGNELPAMDRHRLRRPGTAPEHQVTPDLVDAAEHLPVLAVDDPAAPAAGLDLECGAQVLDFFDDVLAASPTLVESTLDMLRTMPSPPRPPPAAKKRRSKRRTQGKLTITTVPRQVLRAKVTQLHSAVIASAGVFTTGGSNAKKRPPSTPSTSTTTCRAPGPPSTSAIKAITAPTAPGPSPSTVKTSA